ncbi:hypothetical protein ACJZ2D_006051 [Fusarium nematophilum]
MAIEASGSGYKTERGKWACLASIPYHFLDLARDTAPKSCHAIVHRRQDEEKMTVPTSAYSSLTPSKTNKFFQKSRRQPRNGRLLISFDTPSRGQADDHCRVPPYLVRAKNGDAPRREHRGRTMDSISQLVIAGDEKQRREAANMAWCLAKPQIKSSGNVAATLARSVVCRYRESWLLAIRDPDAMHMPMLRGCDRVPLVSRERIAWRLRTLAKLSQRE